MPMKRPLFLCTILQKTRYIRSYKISKNAVSQRIVDRQQKITYRFGTPYMQLIRSYIVPVTIALIPVILTLVCISTLFNASPSSFHPTWNDEIDYWHQILTFVTLRIQRRILFY
jgi:hypothetical protein